MERPGSLPSESQRTPVTGAGAADFLKTLSKHVPRGHTAAEPEQGEFDTVPRAWLVIILLAAGCTSAVAPSPSHTDESAFGGTLRVGLWYWDDPDVLEPALLDPQLFFWHPFARCCLLRTLLAYEGRPTQDGGAELRPDLAADMPEVSADGLTWTFRLREGLRYAPPYEERPIVARDVITALERTVRVGESPYHDVIEGVQAFRDGDAGTIAGAQAPDDLTVIFRLTEPAGDFGNRVAMAYLAPIPEEALAEHGDDYGGYLVASGPYMIEGAEAIDHGDPDAAPTYASQELVLVRNPSWSPDLDAIRPAYVDRIEVVPLPDRETSVLEALASGAIDVPLDPMTPAARNEAAANDSLRSRLRDAPNPFLFYMPMNLAQPPFDDVAVRQAVNAAIDREALLDTFDPTRGSAFVPVAHPFPEVAVSGLLRDYEPNGVIAAGDPDRARDLMAESAYDVDGDGRCDGEACSITANRLFETSDDAIELVEAGLAELGIEVTWVEEPSMSDPTSHVGLGAIAGWVIDYPSANDFVPLLTGAGSPDFFNLSLIGARPEQLAEWGYAVTEVPSLDDKIDVCRTRGGSAAFACWAELDQLLTEQVVAWVPVATSLASYVYGEDVDRFELSGSEFMPALDRIAFAEGSGR
jgi:peptide/nickel transport system substrate-binding protein